MSSSNHQTERERLNVFSIFPHKDKQSSPHPHQYLSKMKSARQKVFASKKYQPETQKFTNSFKKISIKLNVDDITSRSNVINQYIIKRHLTDNPSETYRNYQHLKFNRKVQSERIYEKKNKKKINCLNSHSDEAQGEYTLLINLTEEQQQNLKSTGIQLLAKLQQQKKKTKKHSNSMRKHRYKTIDAQSANQPCSQMIVSSSYQKIGKNYGNDQKLGPIVKNLAGIPQKQQAQKSKFLPEIRKQAKISKFLKRAEKKWKVRDRGCVGTKMELEMHQERIAPQIKIYKELQRSPSKKQKPNVTHIIDIFDGQINGWDHMAITKDQCQWW